MLFFIRVNTSENSFNPPILIEGKWEVALVDLNLNNVPPAPVKDQHVGVRKYKKKDFEPIINHGENGVMVYFYVNIVMDRMIIHNSQDEEDARLRRAFQKYNYGNVGRSGRQTSDFDRWNYRIPLEHFSDIAGIWVHVTCKHLSEHFSRNPEAEITLKALLNILNLDIQAKEDEIKTYIKQMFKGTGGETVLVNTPYFRLPLLSHTDGFIKMETPYWLHKTYIANELNEIFKFDIWNLERVDRESSTVSMNAITMLFQVDTERKLNLQTIIALLNASFRTQQCETYLQHTYSKTSRLTRITEYVDYPQFEIDGDLIHLHLPFYVRKIEMSNWLSKLTGIERNYTRQFILLPNAPLEDMTLTYKMLDPCKRLTSREDMKKGELYALVYCELIEYQMVGSIRSPLLRVVGLDGNKKGINWIQFNSPHYIPVKYQQFQHFDISVHDETGKQFGSKVYLTLHFRKR